MEQIIFTNSRNQSITLGKQRPYFLQFIRGTGTTATDVQMQKAPFQDGMTYTDTLLEPREIILEVVMMANTQEEVFQLRANLSKVFNAKLGEGVLKYEYDGGVKEVKATVEMPPEYPIGSENKAIGYQRAVIILTCPSPFWTDDFESGALFSFNIPNFSFPLELTGENELQTDGTNRFNFQNLGDVETPVRIEFSGPALNPVIENETTGEFIKVEKNIQSSETLIIDTSFGNKKVLLDDGNTITNAFNFIDLNSTFWQLQVGDNEIVYTADTGIDTASVLVQYRNKFVGV